MLTDASLGNDQNQVVLVKSNYINEIKESEMLKQQIDSKKNYINLVGSNTCFA